MVGIYKITNKINNKAYVGQSVDIEHRWKQHLRVSVLPKSIGYNYPIHRAIRKYGEENFSFEVLEECRVEELNAREIYWINYYQTFPLKLGKGYNAWPGGKGNYFRLDENQIREIIEELKRGQVYKKLADKYGVCVGIIGYINRGIKGYALEGFTYPIVTNSSVKKLKSKPHDTNLRKPKKPKTVPCPICSKPMRYGSKMCADCYTRSIKIPVPTRQELLQRLNSCNYNREVAAHSYGVSGLLFHKWCEKSNIKCINKKALKLVYRQEVLGLDLDKHIGPARPKCTKIAQLDPNTDEIIKIYESISIASKAVGCSRVNLSKACDQSNRLAMGYKWSARLAEGDDQDLSS